MAAGRSASLVGRLVRSRALAAGVLVLIIAVPGLWFWPDRGVTVAYYANPNWDGVPFTTRVEDRIALDAIAADPGALPQRQFSAEFTGWLRVDRAGRYTFWTRSDDGSSLR